MIAFEDYIDLLSQLIATPSFSREETAACDRMEAWLRAHEVDRYGSQYPLRRIGNNLILEEQGRGDGRPVLLLNAHIDTVRPAASYTRDPFQPSLEDGWLYGLGSNDDGGSLVALLATFLQLIQKPQPYRLIYSATAAEAVCGREGMDTVLPELGPIALGIIGEPTKMQMAVAERGLMVLDCTARGKSGHAARGEGINAIYAALPAIEWFRTYRFPRVSPWLGPVGMNVTMVQAGTQHNVVPDACTFVVDVRPNGLYANEELLSLIQAAQPSIEIRARSTRLQSSCIDQSSPVVRRGLSLGLEAFGSPTCSNQTLCPFPTLKIGPGDSARSHTADEYIGIEEIRRGIEVYVALLDGLDINP